MSNNRIQPVEHLLNIRTPNVADDQRVFLLAGIDPGVNTGFALWNARVKEYERIITLTFWQCIDMLHSIKNDFPEPFAVIIENPGANKPTFGHHQKFREKISQNIGSNKRDAQLIIEFCQHHNIPVFPKRPGKHSMTGMKPDHFKEYTGYIGSTSGHARDAAMLVFNHDPILLSI